MSRQRKACIISSFPIPEVGGIKFQAPEFRRIQPGLETPDMGPILFQVNCAVQVALTRGHRVPGNHIATRILGGEGNIELPSPGLFSSSCFPGAGIDQSLDLDGRRRGKSIGGEEAVFNLGLNAPIASHRVRSVDRPPLDLPPSRAGIGEGEFRFEFAIISRVSLTLRYQRFGPSISKIRLEPVKGNPVEPKIPEDRYSPQPGGP